VGQGPQLGASLAAGPPVRGKLSHSGHLAWPGPSLANPVGLAALLLSTFPFQTNHLDHSFYRCWLFLSHLLL